MTEQRVQRRLAAILAADVVGYSALMEHDEEATYAEFERLERELIEPSLSRHEGRLIKTTGDGALAEFASPLAALRCAVEIQDHVASGSSPLRLRVGLNLGDVIVGQDGDLYGDGINIAVRLEGIADPGGILISAKVYSEVEGKLDVGFEDRGEQQLKNISKPVRAYAVRAGAHGGLTERKSAAPPLPDKPSIAVLPFENMSGDPEQEYFADGVVEDIITILSRIKSLFVIARNSSFTYKGKAVDVRRVGRELGVRYVLEGSVRKSGERIRITGQLIDTTSGTHVWANRFDRHLDDIFKVQDEISLNLVSAIQPELDRAEIERARRKPDNLTAWDLLLRARAELYKTTKTDNDKAKQLLFESVRADPNSAMAQASLSEAFAYEGFFGWDSPRRCFERAIQHAEEGIRLDQGDPAPHCAMSLALIMIGRAGNAIEYARHAIELDPNTAAGYRLLAVALSFAGDPDEAIAAAEQALRVSPRDPLRSRNFMGIANAHFAAGRYQPALEFAGKAVQTAPNWVGGYLIVATCAAHLGLMEPAHSAVARLLEIAPRYNLAGVQKNPLFAKADVVKRLLDGLRKAGLPE